MKYSATLEFRLPSTSSCRWSSEPNLLLHHESSLSIPDIQLDEEIQSTPYPNILLSEKVGLKSGRKSGTKFKQSEWYISSGISEVTQPAAHKFNKHFETIDSSKLGEICGNGLNIPVSGLRWDRKNIGMLAKRSGAPAQHSKFLKKWYSCSDLPASMMTIILLKLTDGPQDMHGDYKDTADQETTNSASSPSPAQVEVVQPKIEVACNTTGCPLASAVDCPDAQDAKAVESGSVRHVQRQSEEFKIQLYLDDPEFCRIRQLVEGGLEASKKRAEAANQGQATRRLETDPTQSPTHSEEDSWYSTGVQQQKRCRIVGSKQCTSDAMVEAEKSDSTLGDPSNHSTTKPAYPRKKDMIARFINYMSNRSNFPSSDGFESTSKSTKHQTVDDISTSRTRDTSKSKTAFKVPRFNSWNTKSVYSGWPPIANTAHKCEDSVSQERSSGMGKDNLRNVNPISSRDEVNPLHIDPANAHLPQSIQPVFPNSRIVTPSNMMLLYQNRCQSSSPVSTLANRTMDEAVADCNLSIPEARCATSMETEPVAPTTSATPTNCETPPKIQPERRFKVPKFLSEPCRRSSSFKTSSIQLASKAHEQLQTQNLFANTAPKCEDSVSQERSSGMGKDNLQNVNPISSRDEVNPLHIGPTSAHLPQSVQPVVPNSRIVTPSNMMLLYQNRCQSSSPVSTLANRPMDGAVTDCNLSTSESRCATSMETEPVALTTSATPINCETPPKIQPKRRFKVPKFFSEPCRRSGSLKTSSIQLASKAHEQLQTQNLSTTQPNLQTIAAIPYDLSIHGQTDGEARQTPSSIDLTSKPDTAFVENRNAHASGLQLTVGSSEQLYPNSDPTSIQSTMKSLIDTLSADNVLRDKPHAGFQKEIIEALANVCTTSQPYNSMPESTRTSTSNNSVNENVLIQSVVKPHTSSTSGSTGSSSDNADARNKSSVTPGDHKCSYCGRTFTRSDMLVRHKHQHTGDRPFKCDICKRSFTRSDHLLTHQRTHTGTRPYRCEHCLYSACRRDMITRHMRSHQKRSNQAPLKFTCLSDRDKLTESHLSNLALMTSQNESSFQIGLLDVGRNPPSRSTQCTQSTETDPDLCTTSSIFRDCTRTLDLKNASEDTTGLTAA